MGAIRTTLCVLAALAVATTSGADNGPDNEPKGPYVGLGASAGIPMSLEDALSIDEIDVGASGGVDAYGGYRFGRYVAAEGQLEYLPKTKIRFKPRSSIRGETIAEYQALAMTTNVKITPFATRLEPFVLVGLGFLWVELEDELGLGLSESDLGFAVRAGGGVDVHLFEPMAVSLSATYVVPYGDVEDFDYLSVGIRLQYQF